MQLYFQKTGEGPALIILHGLYGLSDNWISIARKLSVFQTVYLVDQRNHGRSPHHPEHSYPAMALDLLELMESEKIKKASIMGHSMGGKTAMLFSAMFPEKVDKLIIVDIGPGGYANIDQHSPQVLAHLNIVNSLLSIDFEKFSSRVQIDKELALTIKDDTVRQFLMKNVHRNPDNTFSWKLNIKAISNAMPAIMGPVDLEKTDIKKSSCKFPVLFIKGEKSDYISPQQQLLISKYFPCAVLKTITGAGHWVHAEQPEAFFSLVDLFLRSQ
jgi:esterase